MKKPTTALNLFLLILTFVTNGIVTCATAQSGPPIGGPEYFDSYYEPNIWNPTSISITNRSSLSVYWGCYFAIELEDDVTGQIRFSGGSYELLWDDQTEDFPRIAANGGWAWYIPELTSFKWMDWFPPLDSNNFWWALMYGVEVDGSATHMVRGGWLPYVSPPPGTVLTAIYWIDTNGSLHIEYTIDDEPTLSYSE